jgi:hypothetical protein
MRVDHLLLSALAAVSLSACNSSSATAAKAAPPAAAQAPVQAAQAPAGPKGLHGKVAEKLDAGGYSYLRITTAAGETWAAVPVSPVAVGADVDVAVQMPMDGFESKTLGRKFEKLVFGTLASAGGAAAAADPHAGLDMAKAAPSMAFAAQAAASKAAPAAADPAPIKVEKASGKDARTVAEVFSAKAELKDKPVAVRGKVVKYNAGILGKNWIHLKDGTGAAGSDDITVTTMGTAAVGDVVTLRGVVHLDKDFGAGYAYGVIIEDAAVD